MKKPAALARTLALLALLAAGAATPLRAEDGYELWLRYRLVADQARQERGSRRPHTRACPLR